MSNLVTILSNLKSNNNKKLLTISYEIMNVTENNIYNCKVYMDWPCSLEIKDIKVDRKDIEINYEEYLLDIEIILPKEVITIEIECYIKEERGTAVEEAILKIEMEDDYMENYNCYHKNYLVISDKYDILMLDCNVSEVELDEVIKYRAFMCNIYDYDLCNVLVEINIPEGTSYVEDSLIINGEKYEENYLEGIYIKSLPINNTLDIVYEVMVNSIPIDKLINNYVVVNYANTQLKAEIETEVSGKVLECIKSFQLESSEYENNYSVKTRLINLGNKVIGNIVLVDILPPGIGCEYGVYFNTNNSYRRQNIGLDNIFIPAIGIGEEIEIIYSITLNELFTKENDMILTTLCYEYIDDNGNVIDRIDEDNRDFKISYEYREAEVRAIKSSVDEIYSLDEPIEYDIDIYNYGNYVAEDIWLIDFNNKCNIWVNGEGLDVVDGCREIYLGELEAKQHLIIKYSVINPTYTTNGQIVSSNKLVYRSGRKEKEYLVNDCVTRLKKNLLEEEEFISKVEFCRIGDVVIYTTSLYNRGNEKIDNITINFEKINNVRYLEDYVKVNNSIVNINNNKVEIKELNPKDSIELYREFKVLDNFPEENFFIKGTVKYNSGNTIQELELQGAIIEVVQDVRLFIEANEEYISKGEEISYKIAIINSGKVPVGISFKMEVSKGMKLIEDKILVDGDIKRFSEEESEIESYLLAGDGVDIEVTFESNGNGNSKNIWVKGIVQYIIDQCEGKENTKVIESERIYTQLV